MHRLMSANAARRLAALLLGLLVMVGAGSPALAAPAAAAPAAAPAIGGIDLPCVLPAGMCKDIKETGKKAIDKTVDGAKWVCDKAKKVCEVAGDTAKGVADGVGSAVDAVSDTIDFATDPLGYLAEKSSPSVGKLVEAIATDGM
ncbi:hypothetical protein [Streptomyces sp. S1D4-20]|uniref:hypothetical protein n=1 Tax=Streptomyces sp. S1D4-20 TaxID=2594462 RepID=UPI001164A063|nr:hypothetical protein [Streptomyces sp. S1D4-20]QDN54272.1 hypothetical protein FNV67_01530 [Streptomyces sp. S1D4-20]